MKITVGFFIGVIFCGMALLGLQAALPIFAQEPTDNSTSDNFSLAELLPDIEQIYQDALMTPFIEAEAKIYDEDIAEFYHKLMEKTNLTGTQE
ncbi:hypothetical protein ACFLW1_01160 [Chloroflexota bacterium]